MTKPKNKSAKQSSDIFHNIIAASVKGNPKPVVKKKANKTSLSSSVEKISKKSFLI